MIIGLAGNSGSGKSLVSNYMETKGAYILDSDKINHYLLENNQNMIGEILDYFGRDILTNEKIDRKKLGKIVFSSREGLDKLEKISHKYIVDEIKEQIKDNKDNYDLFIIDAPLLFEAQLHLISDIIWIVDAPRNTKINRIMARDNISEKDANIRLDNQLTIEDMKVYPHIYIENSGSKEELYNKIDEIIKNTKVDN